MSGAELLGKQFEKLDQTKCLLQWDLVLSSVHTDNMDAEYRTHLLKMPMMKS